MQMYLEKTGEHDSYLNSYHVFFKTRNRKQRDSVDIIRPRGSQSARPEA